MSLSKNRINLAPLAEEPQGNEGDIAIIAGRLKYFYNGQWIQYRGYGFPIGYIGSSPLVINENLNLQRYLNGQKIAIYQFPDFDQALVATANVYPNILKNETEWQAIATSSVGGQCGYFVRDEEEGTIRLPKIIMPIQGLTDLTKLGDLVEAGLPNITGKINNAIFSSALSEADGALEVENSPGNYGAGSSPAPLKSFKINASSSSSTYKDDCNTVQQEQIQYPYFIQVATGVENIVDVTREIQLNNPYTLFDCKYSETKLYNISWLLSSGQWNSKATYPTAYDALLVEYNAEITEGFTVELPSGTSYTKRGLSVKLSTEESTDYDFVINTTDETFRLPIRSKLASSNFAKGNGKTLGLTDGTNEGGLVAGDGERGYDLVMSPTAQGVDVGQAGYMSSTVTNKTIGITTDPTKSGIELSDSNLYLYFYIGETVQDANLINAGRIEETKANIDANNFTTLGQQAISTLSAPSDTQIPFTINASGATYQSPVDGYVIFNKTATSAGQYTFMLVYDSTQTIIKQMLTSISGLANGSIETGGTLRVGKNDIIFIKYTAAGTTTRSYIVPTNAFESEGE